MKSIYRGFLLVGAIVAILWFMQVPTDSVQAVASSRNAVTEQTSTVDIVGHWGGTVYGATIQDDYAYVIVGPVLEIVDIAQRTAPQAVGRLRLPNTIAWVELAGDHAFVAVEHVGLVVVNVANKSAPSIAAIYSAAGASGLSLAGQLVYLVASGDLHVIDIADPTAPSRIALYDEDLGVFRPPTIADGYAYVSMVNGNCDASSGTCGNGLRILDVSNPSQPVKKGFVDGKLVYDAGVYQNTLYIADYYDPFKLVDVSSPDAPVVLPQSVIFGGADAAVLEDGYAYISAGQGLYIYSLAQPTAPTLVGYYAPPTDVFGLDIANGYAYVTDEGLRIVDVRNPAQPVEIAVYQPIGGAINDIAGDGARVYAATSSGLAVLDMADPARPSLIGSYIPQTVSVNQVAQRGQYAYLLLGSGGLEIVDVSNAAAPVLVGVLDTYGSALEVDVEESYLYIASYNDGLRVIDVSNPAAPTQVALLDTPGTAYAVVVQGDTAYVADGGGGLRIIDVSVPTAPTELGSYTQSSNVQDVAVVNNSAFLVSGNRVHAVDVSNPTAPQPLGSYTTIESPVRLAFDGAYLYVAGWDMDLGEGVWVLDITDPLNLTEVGSPVLVPRAPLTAANGYVYLSTGPQGLYVLKLQRPFQATDFLYAPQVRR